MTILTLMCCATLIGCALAGDAPSAAAADQPPAGDDAHFFAWLVARAAEQARRPAADLDAAAPLPESLAKLNYDSYRKIIYRNDRAVWAKSDLPFRVQFYHRGFLHRRRVVVDFINGSSIDRLHFSPAMFEYLPEIREQVHPDTLPHDLGFAGLRVLYPLNKPDKFDELISFLDAAYFRALGAGQVYGASARGVAIDTVAGHGEQFPVFTTFWVRRPDAADRHIVLFALLQGDSLTGAYRFDITPGETTTVDVRAHLVFRKDVEKLGLGALTSMFLNGEDHPGKFDPKRPEIHDSDGLLIAEPDDKWQWRPLTNPDKVTVTDFPADHPLGFGLMQADRVFDHYADREAKYDLRPSIWVQPVDDWGAGRIELVELPTKNEYADNIVAYWTPHDPIHAADQRELHYRLHFTRIDPRNDTNAHPGAWRR